MAAQDFILDGTVDFSGGQNAALHPNNIAENQFAYGINITTQTTTLSPRWGLIEVPLDFSLAGDYTQVSGIVIPFEQVFKGGKFQALIPYGVGPDLYTIYIVSGFAFLINNLTLSVQVLNPTDQLNVNADRIHWSNAGNYLVIFDWPNLAFILDGIQIRRSNLALGEVPTSVLGTYNQNRLCIANAGIDWTAGDPAGSPATPNAPITFLEIETPSSPFVGDVYQIPTANKNNDVITAMGFLQVIDTSTGIGPLLVSTKQALYSYRTDLPRVSWQGGASGFVFGSVLLYNTGIVAQRAFTNVNSDLIFLSSDGQIRALSMARNDQQRWGNSPISREVENFLKYTDTTLSEFAVTATYRNKVFITCNPYRVDCYSSEGILQTDYVNAGVVVLELDNNATLTNKTPPVWAGVWTGVGFLDFAKNNEVFYVAGKHRNQNGLYIFDPEKTYDVVEGKIRYIRSEILTKEYVGRDLTINKKVHSLDLGLHELEEQVKVEVAYKTSVTENFEHWRDLIFNAPVSQCQGFPDFPQGSQTQSIRDLNLGGVDESACNITTDDFVYVYKGLQVRVTITGKHWQLEYVKLKSTPVLQTELQVYCGVKPGVRVPAACFDPWIIPDVDCPPV